MIPREYRCTCCSLSLVRWGCCVFYTFGPLVVGFCPSLAAPVRHVVRSCVVSTQKPPAGRTDKWVPGAFQRADNVRASGYAFGYRRTAVRTAVRVGCMFVERPTRKPRRLVTIDTIACLQIMMDAFRMRLCIEQGCLYPTTRSETAT